MRGFVKECSAKTSKGQERLKKSGSGAGEFVRKKVNAFNELLLSLPALGDCPSLSTLPFTRSGGGKRRNMSSENFKIDKQNSIYFLTFTVIDWVDVFTRLNYKNIIVESLAYCRENKGLKLYAWCLMTNHLHLVCSVEPPFGMSDFVRDYKRHTAKSILKEMEQSPESRRDWILYRFKQAGKLDCRIEYYRFWQDTCHPIELITTEMMEQRINYIHENPVRNGAVASAEEYLFSSARNYADLSAVMEIDIC
jgi:REP element-mobilizing transposase RayT